MKNRPLHFQQQLMQFLMDFAHFCTILPLETWINTVPDLYKLFHFNVRMSPLYVVKLKIAQNQLTAYNSSVDLIVQDFRR